MTTLALALQFLTIFPVRIARHVTNEDLARSMRWYPLVGALLGMLSALVYAGALHVFSPGVAVVAAVVSLIVFSGALHLEGLADVCDAFYGQRDREQVLAILKDSHVGPMAIVGVFCLLALKLALLARFTPTHALRALVLAPALGRWAMVWLCARSVYARPEGTASPYIGHIDRTTLAIATAFAGLIALVMFPFFGLLTMLATFIATEIYRRSVQRRIGGMTGDTLGTCCEIVELLVLACV